MFVWRRFSLRLSLHRNREGNYQAELSCNGWTRIPVSLFCFYSLPLFCFYILTLFWFLYFVIVLVVILCRVAAGRLRVITRQSWATTSACLWRGEGGTAAGCSLLLSTLLCMFRLLPQQWGHSVGKYLQVTSTTPHKYKYKYYPHCWDSKVFPLLRRQPKHAE